MKFKKFMALTFIALILSACVVPSQRGDVYDRTQARKLQQVQEGVILNIRPVKLESGHSNGVGSLAGGVLGGVAGGAIGHGYGQVAGAAVGAVAGALLGNAIEHGTANAEGMEIIVKLRNGKTVAVTQEGSATEFSAGQPVIILNDHSGNARVAPMSAAMQNHERYYERGNNNYKNSYRQ